MLKNGIGLEDPPGIRRKPPKIVLDPPISGLVQGDIIALDVFPKNRGLLLRTLSKTQFPQYGQID
jgi:hypothetical protein